MPVNSHVDLPRYPPGIFTDDRVLSKDAAVSSLPDAVEALQRCDNLVQDLLTEIASVQMSEDVIDTEQHAAFHDFLQTMP